MTVIFLGVVGFVAITIGLGITMTPRETSESFQREGGKVGVPEGMFDAGVVRFTGWAFVAFGVIFIVVAIVMLVR